MPVLSDEIYVSDSHIESPPQVNNESLGFKQFSHEVKLSHLSQTSLDPVLLVKKVVKWKSWSLSKLKMIKTTF